MPVYVDNMEAKFRGMIMCHMIADTSIELFDMARKINVHVQWVQQKGTPHEHFDIAKRKRFIAVSKGAIEITMVQLACMCKSRQYRGYLSTPEEAESWYRERLKTKK